MRFDVPLVLTMMTLAALSGCDADTTVRDMETAPGTSGEGTVESEGGAGDNGEAPCEHPATADNPLCLPRDCATSLCGGSCQQAGVLSCDPPPDIEPWDCGGEDLCPPLVVTTLTSSPDCGEALVDIEGARCVLEALAQATPGRVELRWEDACSGIENARTGAIEAFIAGDRTVLLNVTAATPQAICHPITAIKSGRMALAPAGDARMGECLTAEEPNSLVACLLGEVVAPFPWIASEFGGGDVEAWGIDDGRATLPAWLTRECAEHQGGCPR